MKRFDQRGDEVTIRLTAYEFSTLLIALGMVTGGRERPQDRFYVLQVANMINEGNPQYTPYEIPEEYSWRRKID